MILLATSAQAQLSFNTFQYPGSTITTVTGIRGDNMTGNYSFTGGNTGGLLFSASTLAYGPFPGGTSNPSNYPNATSSTPYGPSFGSSAGILRVVGSYKTTSSGNYDLGYLYDGAAAPGSQLTTLIFPGGSTLNTILHSTFGNQVVGNYDTSLATGNALIYNISAGTFTNANIPGATSTTAYGVYGDRISGGYYVGPVQGERGYIYNQDTATYTSYNAPGSDPTLHATSVTHFEGITSAGRANTFNLVADSVDDSGTPHAWVAHVDSLGVATWTEIAVPGAASTSANSMFGNTVIGVYVKNGVTYAYTVQVSGLYDPVTNSAALSFAAPGAVGITGGGDDVINSGSISMTGANAVGISGGTYGLVSNSGTIASTGAGGSAVQMTGSYGTLLNSGTLRAPSGAYALSTDGTAVGTLAVNNGIIDGQVAMSAGSTARFENSGWMGISSAGAGTGHTLSGTFAQTSAGTLSLRVSPTTSDSLTVNGVARLAGTLQAAFQPGTYSARSYTVLTATGGRTGTFSNLATANLPGLLTASLSYGANDVTLSIRAASQSMSGLGSNLKSVGTVLDNAYNSPSGLANMPGLFTLSRDQIPQALAVLSGANASIGQTGAFSAGQGFSSVLTGHVGSQGGGGGSVALAQACGDTGDGALDDAARDRGLVAPLRQWSAWTSGFAGGQWLNADGTTGAAASQQSIGGGAFGADYHFAPESFAGIALGISGSGYSVPANAASGQATGLHAGLYGRHEWNGFRIDAAATYGRFDNSSTRFISIGTPETAKASYVTNQLSGRLELGRRLGNGKATLMPFVAVEPAILWQPAYGESSLAVTGAPGVYALTYQAQATGSFPGLLGAEIESDFELGGRPLRARARFAWVHEFMTERSVTAGFVGLPGSSFTVDGARAAGNAARIDVGATYGIGERTSLFVNAMAELSDRGQGASGTAGFRLFW